MEIINKQRLILAKIHNLCTPIGEDKDGRPIYPDVPQKVIDDLWKEFEMLYHQYVFKLHDQ